MQELLVVSERESPISTDGGKNVHRNDHTDSSHRVRYSLIAEQLGQQHDGEPGKHDPLIGSFPTRAPRLRGDDPQSCEKKYAYGCKQLRSSGVVVPPVLVALKI